MKGRKIFAIAGPSSADPWAEFAKTFQRRRGGRFAAAPASGAALRSPSRQRGLDASLFVLQRNRGESMLARLPRGHWSS
jgi:hypothetical protein